jgi:hypothetical protein
MATEPSLNGRALASTPPCQQVGRPIRPGQRKRMTRPVETPAMRALLFGRTARKAEEAE